MSISSDRLKDSKKNYLEVYPDIEMAPKRVNAIMPPSERPIKKAKSALTLDMILEILKKAEDAANTVRNYTSTVRVLGRIWYRRQNGLPLSGAKGAPTLAQLKEVDYAPLFARGPRGVVSMLYEAFDNRSTAATHMGYIQRLIKTPKVMEVIGWTDEDIGRFVEFHRDAKLGVEDSRKSNTPSKKLQGKSYEWQNLIDLEKQLRAGPEYGSPMHALTALHTVLGPRRNHDMTHLKWATTTEGLDPKFNHISVTSDGVSIEYTEHKTKKFTDVVRVDLDQTSKYASVATELSELANILRRLYASRGDDKVFKNVPALINDISGLAFGSPLGITEFRRLHSDWLFRQRYTTRQLELVSELVGHNLLQSMQYITAPIGSQPSTSASTRDFTILESQLLYVLRGAADLLATGDVEGTLEVLHGAISELG